LVRCRPSKASVRTATAASDRYFRSPAISALAIGDKHDNAVGVGSAGASAALITLIPASVIVRSLILRVERVPALRARRQRLKFSALRDLEQTGRDTGRMVGGDLFGHDLSVSEAARRLEVQHEDLLHVGGIALKAR
jgi:hypothetical protein